MIFLNWKANGSKELVKQYNELSIPQHKVVPLVPSPFISMLNATKFEIGTQNASPFPKGAYTGEVTAEILAEFGVKYCLVGHSERRHYLHEGNEVISKKIQRLLSNEITPILCVGENSLDRANNTYFEVLKKQMEAFVSECIVAYEPVWAIGTGSTPSNHEIDDVINWIKQQYEQSYNDPKVLYGGSVSAKNIANIAQTKADGVLVGGASLKPEEILEITKHF
ncbi:MAG: triose-phosphate isomerase [Proteobacteria bacterium]|nr:triose-phosphate isomerase [Pseudomonadota bacterium]